MVVPLSLSQSSDSATGIDISSGQYQWQPQVTVSVDNGGTIVIGDGIPRAHLLTNPPPRALEILHSFIIPQCIADVLADFDGKMQLWEPILAELIQAELLVSDPPPHPIVTEGCRGEQQAQGVMYGPAWAYRAMLARADALLVVVGASPLAHQLITILSAAGVGHIYHDAPERDGRAIAVGLPATYRHWTRSSRPAPQCPPTIVIFTETTIQAQSHMATLISSRVPYLVVEATAEYTAVGPCVLPGKTACYSCIQHHYEAIADHGVSAHPIIDPPLLTQLHAALLAAEQVLTFLDTQSPPPAAKQLTVYPANQAQSVNYPVQFHEQCRCRFIATATVM